MQTNQHAIPLRLLLRLGAVGATACIGFLLMGARADAQVQIAESKTTISNEGTASADTGNNSGIGNDSVNETSNTQTASPDDGSLPNISDEENDSDGTASLETGSATAVGNATHTVAVQTLGPDTTVTPLPASAGIDSAAPSSASIVDAVLPQGGTTARGDVAAATPRPGPVSTGDTPGTGQAADGSSIAGTPIATVPAASASSSSLVPETSSGIDNATAPAAAAPATAPRDNSILGAVSGAGPPPGLATTTQSIRISNDGDADANTGGNDLVDGDILTGDALAMGNQAGSTVLQAAAATGDLALIDQAARVGNDGDAVASTGDNAADSGDVTSGNASAQGNVSSTSAEQRIAADTTDKQLDQRLGAANHGGAAALTGDNSVAAGEDGEVTISTGTADAIGNLARVRIGQQA
ncbi:MAG: hypothetical protein QOE35_819 [Actinomycetota bacterium]|jgi:hypothetical protein